MHRAVKNSASFRRRRKARRKMGHRAEHRIRHKGASLPASFPSGHCISGGRYSEESARFESRGDAAGI